MKISLISDDLTNQSLIREIDCFHLKNNFFDRFLLNRSDFLLVESAWNGNEGRFRHQIASYPEHTKRNNEKLLKLLEIANKKGIPTVFWDKEGEVHFDRFIDSAKYFDHILTVDENCVSKFRKIVPESTSVNIAMFPVQPKIHSFRDMKSRTISANFVGSYNSHSLRQVRQEMLFNIVEKTDFPLTIYDRNYSNHLHNLTFPKDKFNLNIRPNIKYLQTAQIYQNDLVSFNVNTVENSPTMFSRRVVEILACGGILISTPSVAVERLFSDYCYIIQSEEEGVELLNRLKYGPTKFDIERAKAGSDFVLNNLTWDHFLKNIYSIIK